MKRKNEVKKFKKETQNSRRHNSNSHDLTGTIYWSLI
jgi:hypothetical protein